MASLTVLSSPNASTNGNTFLLTTAAPTVAKIAPKRSSEGGRSRRNSGRPTSPPSTRGPSVARRNERERNRVRQVNLGFATLRNHVPNRSKKMSKVETLRSAVQYIRQLQSLLGETGSGPDSDDICCGSDENCGGVPAFAEAFARSQPHLASSAGGASAGSPAPSLGSDASSPYDSLSPEDEELIDFTTWLS